MYKNLNFSLWCDFIERDFLDNGFRDLINNKIITGATSNPAIFESAFKSEDSYQELTDFDFRVKYFWMALLSWDI